MTVIGDDRRRTDDAVLDHRSLFQGPHDALCTALNTALTSPTPWTARSTMLTVVIGDAPQHPVDPI